ncbi:MAG: PorT family protein [Flavobacteriales bacterium]|nr:PorT family protein [Flavobacteriales bacterium]
MISTFGQSEELNSDYSADQSEARDRVVLEITNDGWLDIPDDIDYRRLSLGINAYVIHDIFRQIDKPFSIGLGYGISSHNVHTDGVFTVVDSLESSYAFYNKIEDDANLKKNKYTINYLEFPVELRMIQDNGAGFKVHLGGKFAYKLGDYSKRVDGFGKRKSYKTAGIHDFRYSLHARIGYGRLTAVGSYSLNPLFKKNRGPQLTQYSVGIAFIIL